MKKEKYYYENGLFCENKINCYVAWVILIKYGIQTERTTKNGQSVDTGNITSTALQGSGCRQV